MLSDRSILALAVALHFARGKGGSLPTALQRFTELAVEHLPPFVSDIIGIYLFARAARFLFKLKRFVLYEVTFREIKNFVGSWLAKLAKFVPGVSGKIDQEMKKVEADMEHEIKGSIPAEDRGRNQLPERGWDSKTLLSKMSSLAANESTRWKNGYVSGSVYHGGSDMLELQSSAMKLYDVSNPLHADMWPSLSKYEAEVIAMTASLVNGGNESVCGTVTSGGTESIFMAAKAHREWAKKTKGVTEPEIVAPVNAHAAIDKACEVLGIKLIHVPIDPKTSRVVPSELRKRMSRDTIMIYSSAPSFPHGIIDPIEELSKLAKEFNCGLHVDCCLGGFVLPFLKKLGPEYALKEKFDFELPGVTSMSLDTHKFGYAAKGTSVVLYRNKEFRHYQFFAYPQWTGGLYITPTMAGSRPGALVAAAWAAMMHTGLDGYLSATKKIVDCARAIKKGISEIPELYVCGNPEAMVVGFGAKDIDIYRVGQLMNKKGWALNMLQRPASAHICVTLPVSPFAQRFLDDLKDSVAQLRDQKGKPAGSAPVYGVAAALPDGPLVDILNMFLDVVYKV